MFLSRYSFYQYQRSGSTRTVLFEQRVKDALRNSDLEFFTYLLRSELTILAIDYREPQIALEMLGLFFNNNNIAIKNLIQTYLSHVTSFYPNEVDSFLEEYGASQELRLYVKTHKPPETIGETLGQRAYNLLLDLIGQYPLVRTQVIRVLAAAAEYHSIEAWLNYSLREVINLVYGGDPLAPAPQPLPKG